MPTDGCSRVKQPPAAVAGTANCFIRHGIQCGAFAALPRTGTTVVMVGRTASADTALGGEVSFLGFLTILLLFC